MWLTMSSLLAGVGIALLLLVATPAPVGAAVASIDLGTEWLKVAVVHLQPGRPPISIVINEMSKRKSPSLAAVISGNRLVGEEAAGVTARFPHLVFSHLTSLLAKPFEHAQSFAKSIYLPFDLVPDSRGAAAVRAEDGAIYTVEELISMILSYAMKLAESHVGAPVKDAVITVPAFLGQAERTGLLQAAKLAGINVLSLINEHAGAALQYGIDKDFSNGSRNVVFYDIGSSGTYAALVHFSSYNTKEFGKTVAINQFQVKDVRWKSNLGGQDMEMRLVEYFADEFNKKLGSGVDVRNHPKAMAKLKKQVKRTKEILSANTGAPISVESLYSDLDFRSTITRDKFEELCGDLWDQALIPLKELLQVSGLKLDDIYAVELIGGATRVPKLQAKLQEFLRRDDLDKHLDADEAIVLGSSLFAANISDGIKLNRKLGMIDGSSYGIVLDINGPDFVKDENVDLLLVPRMKKMPIKMYRSIRHNKDFEISLNYDQSFEFPPGVTSSKFAQYTVSGLTEASEKYATRNLSAPIKASVHFSLSRSGIISLDRAEAVIEISEWVEVPKKNVTLENIAAGNVSNSSEVKPPNSSDDQGTADADKVTTDTNSTLNSNVEEKEMKLKKRIFRVPLKILEKPGGPGILSEDLFAEAKNRLEALDKKDAERRRTAELKNSLEGYIYSTKEKMEDNAEIVKVTTEQDRLSFLVKLNEIQDWLYMDGEDAQATEFKERLDELKTIGDPIFFRVTELTARPAACGHARMYLDELQKILKNWETDKVWLPKTKVDEVRNDAEKLKSWIDEKESQQKNTPDIISPVFSSQEVYEKVLKLQDKVSSVNRIPKPKPKIEKPSKDESANKENMTESRQQETSPETESQPDDPSSTPSTGDHSTEDQHDEL